MRHARMAHYELEIWPLAGGFAKDSRERSPRCTPHPLPVKVQFDTEIRKLFTPSVA